MAISLSSKRVWPIFITVWPKFGRNVFFSFILIFIGVETAGQKAIVADGTKEGDNAHSNQFTAFRPSPNVARGT